MSCHMALAPPIGDANEPEYSTTKRVERGGGAGSDGLVQEKELLLL